jgi:dTDP-glucose pyrophosphorylase
VIVTGYLAEVLERHLGDGKGVGIKLSYARQEVTDGTGSAVLLARSEVGVRPFLITFGDILIHFDNYKAALRRFEETGCDLLMAVNPVEDPYAGAAIYADESGRVNRVIEKPPPGSSTTNWNHAGLVVARPVLFEYLSALKPSPRGEYELTGTYEPMIRDGLKLVALPVQGYWGDIGIRDDLRRMSVVLAKEHGG